MYYNDYLYHRKHKYIKKVKTKNGKYRYIYDVKDALGFDEREAYRKAQSKADEAKKRHDHMLDVKESVNDDAWYKFRNDPLGGEERYRTTASGRVESTVDAMNRKVWGKGGTYQAMTTSRNIANTAQKAYSKTPLYKLERASAKGKKFLDKLFNR